MKKLKLSPAFALALLLCLASCTQQEISISKDTNNKVNYRSQLFDTPCNNAQANQSCTNTLGYTQFFQSPRCASQEDFLAAIGGEIQRTEYFQTFRMEDAHFGITYCQPQIHAELQSNTVVCEEKCVGTTFNYWNTGTGDWTLYLMSNTEWKANNLVIYGLEYPYTYTIEDFQNHGEPLPDGWWFEVRIHPKDWDKILNGVLFSAKRQ